jgi:hypothetical protein
MILYLMANCVNPNRDEKINLKQVKHQPWFGLEFAATRPVRPRQSSSRQEE